MKREIKFKAWDYVTKQIADVEYFINEPFEMTLLLNDPVRGGKYRVTRAKNTLIQFTGLKDKNGKEIYEGDYCDNRGGYVSFCDKCVGYQFFYRYDGNEITSIPKDICHCCDGNFSIQEVRDDINIIGNIYQDSHLIK